MVAICVDDEPILLKWLVNKVENSVDIDSAFGFSEAEDTIEFAKNNKFDIAFLDIELSSMNGIELAKNLRKINPNCGIVFCTGHANYAVDAIKDLIVNGYLLKPIIFSDVQSEIDKFKKYNEIARQIITVDFSHGIEVFDSNGKLIQFKRKLTLKLFYELVNAKGKSLSVRELCSKLWNDNSDSYLCSLLNYSVILFLINSISLRSESSLSTLLQPCITVVCLRSPK